MTNTLIIADIFTRVFMFGFIFIIFNYMRKAFVEFFREEPNWQLDVDDDDWQDYLDDYEEPLFLCTCGEWCHEDEMQKIITKNGSYWICDSCVF